MLVLYKPASHKSTISSESFSLYVRSRMLAYRQAICNLFLLGGLQLLQTVSFILLKVSESVFPGVKCFVNNKLTAAYHCTRVRRKHGKNAHDVISVPDISLSFEVSRHPFILHQLHFSQVIGYAIKGFCKSDFFYTVLANHNNASAFVAPAPSTLESHPFNKDENAL